MRAPPVCGRIRKSWRRQLEHHQDVALERIEIVVRDQPQQGFAVAALAGRRPSRLSTAWGEARRASSCGRTLPAGLQVGRRKRMTRQRTRRGRSRRPAPGCDERAVGQTGDRRRVEFGDGRIVEGAPLVAAVRFRDCRPSPRRRRARPVGSSLMATTRPSARAVIALMPPFAGRSAISVVPRPGRNALRGGIAPDAMVALERHQPRAVRQAGHRFGVRLPCLDRLAVEAAQLADPCASQSDEVALCRRSRSSP